MDLHNDDIEIDVHFDESIRRFRIRDSHGEFVPISIAMWKRCVLDPFRAMKEHGTSYQRVIEIFMEEYRHLYICSN